MASVHGASSGRFPAPRAPSDFTVELSIIRTDTCEFLAFTLDSWTLSANGGWNDKDDSGPIYCEQDFELSPHNAVGYFGEFGYAMVGPPTCQMTCTLEPEVEEGVEDSSIEDGRYGKLS